MNKFKIIALYFMLFVAFVWFFYGAWYASKELDYTFSYKGKVETTVKDLVKRECLK